MTAVPWHWGLGGKCVRRTQHEGVAAGTHRLHTEVELAWPARVGAGQPSLGSFLMLKQGTLGSVNFPGTVASDYAPYMFKGR